MIGDSEEHAFLIPEHLQTLIPVRPKKPHFLFKGANFRHTFFKDKQILLLRFAQLYRLNPQTISYRNLTNDPIWLQLQGIQNSITDQLHLALKQPKRRFFTFYKKESNQLLEEWQYLLLEQLTQVVLHQISFLKKFVNDPPFLEHLNEEPVFEEKTVQEIRTLFDDIRNTIYFIQEISNGIKRLITIKEF